MINYDDLEYLITRSEKKEKHKCDSCRFFNQPIRRKSIIEGHCRYYELIFEITIVEPDMTCDFHTSKGKFSDERIDKYIEEHEKQIEERRKRTREKFK